MYDGERRIGERLSARLRMGERLRLRPRLRGSGEMARPSASRATYSTDSGLVSPVKPKQPSLHKDNVQSIPHFASPGNETNTNFIRLTVIPGNTDPLVLFRASMACSMVSYCTKA